MSQKSFVIDASAVVALLIDAGPEGEWVAETVSGAVLHAPDLMPYEAGNILRRHSLAELLDNTAATLAYNDLVELSVHLYPHTLTARRGWELRQNVTTYDAAYVALAESLDLPLVTLDRKLKRVTVLQCLLLAPPE